MSKLYVRKFPVDHMRKVVEAVKKASAQWEALDQERAAIPATSREMEAFLKKYGEAGQERIDQARADLKEKEEKIRTDLAAIVEAERTGYMNDINDMFTVRPEQLTGNNATELQLLQLELIDTPDAINAFVQRNSENPALVKLACRYADKQADQTESVSEAKKWRAISAENNTETVLRSFESWFTTTGAGAAASPNGYSAMMCMRHNMELDTMQHYGLLEEYSASTGVAIDAESLFRAANGGNTAE